MPFKILYNAFSFCFAKTFLTIFLIYLKSATPFPKCYLQKRNGLLIRKTAIKSSRPFHCAYHPLTP